MIEVTNITKIYRIGSVETKALDGVSLKIKKGEFVAIMGPSGSGKSTFMHILGALDRPTSGKYLLEGKNIEKLTDDELADIRNQKIGFVFQAYNLLPRITALKKIMLPMMYSNSHLDLIEREQRAKQYLKMVGLENKANNRPNQLSGGEQQRVAIARALILNPAIILADEPTGNVATNQAEEIMKILEQLHRQGRTIIIITHEEDIAQHAKRIIKLRDGVIIDDSLL